MIYLSVQEWLLRNAQNTESVAVNLKSPAAKNGPNGKIENLIKKLKRASKSNFAMAMLSSVTVVKLTKLAASDGVVGSKFGRSVSLDGNYALIGASNDDSPNLDQGSAYVFLLSGTTWSQQAKLIASNGIAYDYFGYSVSLSGDYALIGAYDADIDGNANQGSAYVFVRSSTTWSEQAQLVAADGAADDFFGYSVSLSGDYALMGAMFDAFGASTYQGSAYIFLRSGTVWNEQAKLVAADGAASDRFGNSVFLSGNYALIGAHSDDVGSNTNQGSAYVFLRSGSLWNEQAKLVSTDGAAADRFGESVSISGDYALIGAYQDVVGSNTNQGSAYVFLLAGTDWTQQTQLVASDGVADDLFGWSVSIDGDYALVGACDEEVPLKQGSAYVYQRSGTTWSQQAKLVASDGTVDDQFAYSVFLSGDYALIGANDDEIGGNSGQGSAYVYIRSGTAWNGGSGNDDVIDDAVNDNVNDDGSGLLERTTIIGLSLMTLIMMWA